MKAGRAPSVRWSFPRAVSSPDAGMWPVSCAVMRSGVLPGMARRLDVGACGLTATVGWLARSIHYSGIVTTVGGGGGDQPTVFRSGTAGWEKSAGRRARGLVPGNDSAPRPWHATCRARAAMRYAREFVTSTVVGGLFVVVPVYLAVLLLLKGMKSVGTLVRPFAALLPSWVPAENLLGLAVVVVLCFLVGIAIRTRSGRAMRERLERVFFERLPGYGLVRSLTQRLAGDREAEAWKPALVEIEDALTPAFVIEEHEDGRFTVFVPSVPTPFAGAVYVLSAERVHVLDVPFTQAIRTISQWGSGSRQLVAAMGKREEFPQV
jgi:uncharacterized membrane protein